jgi:hypothetical protein
MVPDAKMTLGVEGQLTGSAIDELQSPNVVRNTKIVK